MGTRGAGQLECTARRCSTPPARRRGPGGPVDAGRGDVDDEGCRHRSPRVAERQSRPIQPAAASTSPRSRLPSARRAANHGTNVRVPAVREAAKAPLDAVDALRKRATRCARAPRPARPARRHEVEVEPAFGRLHSTACLPGKPRCVEIGRSERASPRRPAQARVNTLVPHFKSSQVLNIINNNSKFAQNFMHYNSIFSSRINLLSSYKQYYKGISNELSFLQNKRIFFSNKCFWN